MDTDVNLTESCLYCGDSGSGSCTQISIANQLKWTEDVCQLFCIDSELDEVCDTIQFAFYCSSCQSLLKSGSELFKNLKEIHEKIGKVQSQLENKLRKCIQSLIPIPVQKHSQNLEDKEDDEEDYWDEIMKRKQLLVCMELGHIDDFEKLKQPPGLPLLSFSGRSRSVSRSSSGSSCSSSPSMSASSPLPKETQPDANSEVENNQTEKIDVVTPSEKNEIHSPLISKSKSQPEFCEKKETRSVKSRKLNVVETTPTPKSGVTPDPDAPAENKSKPEQGDFDKDIEQAICLRQKFQENDEMDYVLELKEKFSLKPFNVMLERMYVVEAETDNEEESDPRNRNETEMQISTDKSVGQKRTRSGRVVKKTFKLMDQEQSKPELDEPAMSLAPGNRTKPVAGIALGIDPKNDIDPNTDLKSESKSEDLEQSHSIWEQISKKLDRRFGSFEEIALKKDDEITFPCTLTDCEKIFDNEDDREEHVQRFHEGFQYPFRCKLCNKPNFTYTRFLHHQNVHNGLTPFSCPVLGCNKTFHTARDLAHHRRRSKHISKHPLRPEHRIQPNKTSSVTSESENKNTKSVPLKTKKRCKYNCEICGTNCFSLKKLQEHQTIHEGQFPYKCTQSNCLRSFAAERNLKTHFRSAHGPARFQCYLCDKTFRQAHNFRAHLKTHNKRDLSMKIGPKQHIKRSRASPTRIQTAKISTEKSPQKIEQISDAIESVETAKERSERETEMKLTNDSNKLEETILVSPPAESLIENVNNPEIVFSDHELLDFGHYDGYSAMF